MKHGVTVVTPATPPRVSFFLSRAIASVQAQTHLPATHIVTIDHARDGEAATRNRGLFAVDTEWTAFLDDDDYLYPHHLKTLLMHQETTGADLVYPWFDVGSGGTDPFPDRKFQPWDRDEFLNSIVTHHRNYIPVTYLVRTAAAQAVGGFPLPETEDWPLAHGVDWGFHRRLVEAGARYAHVPEVTWCWDHHGGNYSGRVWT